MINCSQFRIIILRPVLLGLQMWSEVSEELMIATCAQESLGGSYLKQEGGPALGIFMMEPKTHDDIWQKFLPNHSEVAHRLMTVCQMATKPKAEMMVYNLFYATAMARIFYLRVPQALPNLMDIDTLWEYYKKWFNTEAGKATHEEFVLNYRKFTGESNESQKRRKDAGK